MLKKLLKYDLKSLFKYWWIVAVVALSLSVAGGFALNIMSSETYKMPEIVMFFSGMLFFLVIMALSFMSLVAFVLIFIRFYKNQFSDEGYLTFTLPVKRSTLLNSKIISSTVILLATFAVMFIGFGTIFVIGVPDFFINADTWKAIFEGFADILREDALLFLTVMLESFVIFVLSNVFSVLFLFLCITFGSVITKKHKVIASIGIYYGVNSVISFATQIFFFFAMPGFISHIEKLPESSYEAMFVLSLLAVILFISAVCGVLYIIQYWMLDRKLNLA